MVLLLDSVADTPSLPFSKIEAEDRHSTSTTPGTTSLDLPVDLHTFIDDLVWGYLDDARDPDQVVEGAELWVGSRRHAVRARVEQLTDEPSGTIVTLRLLD